MGRPPGPGELVGLGRSAFEGTKPVVSPIPGVKGAISLVPCAERGNGLQAITSCPTTGNEGSLLEKTSEPIVALRSNGGACGARGGGKMRLSNSDPVDCSGKNGLGGDVGWEFSLDTGGEIGTRGPCLALTVRTDSVFWRSAAPTNP